MADAYNFKMHKRADWSGPVKLWELLIVLDQRRRNALQGLGETRVMHNGVCHIVEYDDLHRTYTLTPLRDERIIIERA